MNRKLKGILLRYGITMLVGAALVWLVLDQHGYARLTELVDQRRTLSNAFTIPGTILLMSGLLVMISDSGALDGLTYALNWLKLTLFPVGRQPSYTDHVERRRKRPKGRGGFLVITGLLFLAVAVVYLILFYQIYEPMR